METNKKVTRKMLVDEIELIYRNYVNKRVHVGLCYCHIQACNKLFGVGIDPPSLRLLPAFIPPLFYLDFGEYWWPIDDKADRFDFCDKLRNLYKDDETDLTPIVHGYLEFDVYVDREAYAKKYLECYEKNIPFP